MARRSHAFVGRGGCECASTTVASQTDCMRIGRVERRSRLLTLILHPPPIPIPPMPPIVPPVEEAISIMPVVVGDMLMPDIATPVLVGGIDVAELIGMFIADDIDISIASRDAVKLYEWCLEGR
jgi:hypothetical protein